MYWKSIGEYLMYPPVQNITAVKKKKISNINNVLRSLIAVANSRSHGQS